MSYFYADKVIAIKYINAWKGQLGEIGESKLPEVLVWQMS